MYFKRRIKADVEYASYSTFYKIYNTELCVRKHYLNLKQKITRPIVEKSKKLKIKISIFKGRGG